jgi:hypothetical protein
MFDWLIDCFKMSKLYFQHDCLGLWISHIAWDTLNKFKFGWVPTNEIQIQGRGTLHFYLIG